MSKMKRKETREPSRHVRAGSTKARVDDRKAQLDASLTEALEETFPASDALSSLRFTSSTDYPRPANER